MSICPVCGAEITEDFGIVECEGCQAQLVIHLDGRVEHAGTRVADDEAIIVSEDLPPEDPAEEAATFIEPIREFEMEPDPELMGPPPLPEPSTGNYEFPQEDDEPQNLTGEPADEASNDSPIDPLAVLDLADEASAESYENAQKKTHAIDSADLADVAKFANSPDSGGRDGSLRYTLFIEGIDTADVREAFKEAITDKKLLWDTENILRSIKRGEVKIENVSSAKAHIVVTRLKLLPISVSWEQHAIHES